MKYINLIASFLKGRMIIDQQMSGLKRLRRISIPRFTNYIRISTLELAADEIYTNKVEGVVAELGVYKGEFSKYINSLFPDRHLYLFDTFEGFDEKDVAFDNVNRFSTGTQNFSDTSIQTVLAKMKFQEQCIVKKGRFPDSLDGLEERFCFVSLDADLYQPIYDGLVYFYPRLNNGGYIFVHDYNNHEYEGAKAAVRKFCKENNISYTPMTDTWGSVIISK